MSGQPQFHPGDFRRGLRHAGLTHGEYRVAVELAEYARPGKPTVWPSATTLAEICGMTKRGIQLVLDNLEAKGAIACAGRTKGGRGHTNHWRLLVIPAPETVNDASPFTDPERVNDASPFTDERANENAEKGEGERTKGRTKTHERANDGSPEVVEVVGSSGEVDARASEPADPTGSHSPESTPPQKILTEKPEHRDEKRFRDLCASVPVEPPDRQCETHDSWDGPACPCCGGDRRAFEAWEHTSKRVLGDMERLRDNTRVPGLSAVVTAERRKRLDVLGGTRK